MTPPELRRVLSYRQRWQQIANHKSSALLHDQSCHGLGDDDSLNSSIAVGFGVWGLQSVLHCGVKDCSLIE